MTEVPDALVWVVVGAVVVEGIALAIITYLIWQSYQTRPPTQQPAPPEESQAPSKPK